MPLGMEEGLALGDLMLDGKPAPLPKFHAAFRRGRSLAANISWGRGRSWGIFFGFCKTGHILLSDSANCTVLRAVVLTQYRRVTDGRTDRRTDRQTDRQTELPQLVQRL